MSEAGKTIRDWPPEGLGAIPRAVADAPTAPLRLLPPEHPQEQPTQVTDHFALYEFAQPTAHGFYSEPYPAEWISERLLPLCRVLETLRAALGMRHGRDVPIRIVSGYRSSAYNLAVDGAPDSQHKWGRAADIEVAGVEADEVEQQLLELHRQHAICIGGLGRYTKHPQLVHVDIRPGDLVRWTR